MAGSDDKREKIFEVYDALKSRYGDKMSVSRDEFFKYVSTDTAKAGAVYDELKSLYGGDLGVSRDDFIGSVSIKKKDLSSGGSSPSSAGSGGEENPSVVSPSVKFPEGGLGVDLYGEAGGVQASSSTAVAERPSDPRIAEAVSSGAVNLSNDDISKIVESDKAAAQESYHLPGSDFVTLGDVIGAKKGDNIPPELVRDVDKPATLNDFLVAYGAYPSDIGYSQEKYDLVKDKPLRGDEYERILTRLQHNPDYAERARLREAIKPGKNAVIGVIKGVTKNTIPWIRDLASTIELPETLIKRAVTSYVEKKEGVKFTPEEKAAIVDIPSAIPSAADGLKSFADFLEKRLDNPNSLAGSYEMPDNFIGKVLEKTTGFLPFIAAMAIPMEFAVGKVVVPGAFTLLGGKGAVTGLAHGLEAGDDMVEALKKGGIGGAEGLAMAGLLSLFGYSSSKVAQAIARKTGSSLLSALGMHGTMSAAFTAQDAIMQKLNTGKVNMEDAVATGLAALPMAAPDVVRGAIGKGLYNFISYDKMWMRSPRSPQDLRALSGEYVEEAAKAKEAGDEKKFTGYMIAAAHADGWADALAVRDGFLKSPGQFTKFVKSIGLEKDIEDAVLRKARDVMAEMDPRARLAADMDAQADAIREEISMIESNDKLTPFYKKARVKELNDQLQKIESNVEKLLASAEGEPALGEEGVEEKPSVKKTEKEPTPVSEEEDVVEKPPVSSSEPVTERSVSEKGVSTTQTEKAPETGRIGLVEKALAGVKGVFSRKVSKGALARMREVLVKSGIDKRVVDDSSDAQVHRMVLDPEKNFAIRERDGGKVLEVDYPGVGEHKGVKVYVPENKKSPVVSENGVSIDLRYTTKIPKRDMQEWRRVDINKNGKTIGSVMVQQFPGMMRVRMMDIGDAAGKGLGKDVYTVLREEALRRGMELHSDEFLNDKSAPLWESFVKRGWAERSGNGYVFRSVGSEVAKTDFRASSDIYASNKYRATNLTPELGAKLREMYLASGKNRDVFGEELKKDKALFSKIKKLPGMEDASDAAIVRRAFNAGVFAEDFAKTISQKFNGTENFLRELEAYRSGIGSLGLSKEELEKFTSDLDVAKDLASTLAVKPLPEERIKPTEGAVYGKGDLKELRDNADRLREKFGVDPKETVELVNNLIKAWDEATGGHVDSSFLYRDDTLETLYSIANRISMMRPETAGVMKEAAQSYVADVAGEVVTHLIKAAENSGVLPQGIYFFASRYGYENGKLTHYDNFRNDFIRYLRIGERPTTFIGRVFDFIRGVFKGIIVGDKFPERLRSYFDVLVSGENLAEYEIKSRIVKHPDGHSVTKVSPVYKESGNGNVWVRQSKETSNKGRVLMVQFSNKMFKELGEDKELAAYYDKLYSKRRGYHRSPDFWEIPWWVAKAAAATDKGDFYVIRNIDEARKFLKESGYKDLAFSALDVNVKFIRQLASEFPDVTFHVGGYGSFERTLSGLDNVKIYKDIGKFYKAMGGEKPGYDYRHFKGMKTIPRLQMSIGCKHKCVFCDPSIPRKVLSLSDAEIWRQVDAMKDLHVELVYLDDKTFGQADNYRKLKDVYERMSKDHPEFLGFVIQTTAEQLSKMDVDFMRDAGIRYAEIGVESYNNNVLKNMHKPANTKVIDKAVANARKANIDLVVNLMYGYPGETRATYENTVNFVVRNSDVISHINIYSATPYEGTEFARQVGAITESDMNENIRIKSWMEDPAAVDWFIDKITDITDRMLDVPSRTDIRAIVGEIGGERNLSGEVGRGVMTRGFMSGRLAVGVDGKVVSGGDLDNLIGKSSASLLAPWAKSSDDAVKMVSRALNTSFSFKSGDLASRVRAKYAAMTKKIDALVGHTEENGGVTFDFDGNIVHHDSGYQVGGFVDTGIYDKLTSSVVRDYVSYAAKQGAELGDGFELGIWKYKGRYYLDVSKHFSSKVDALKYVKENNEKAAYAWGVDKSYTVNELIGKIRKVRGDNKYKSYALASKSGDKVISAEVEDVLGKELPPESEPPEGERVSGEPEEGGMKKHRIGVRIIESAELPEGVKSGIRDKGIEYVPVNMDIAYKDAEEMVRVYASTKDGLGAIEDMIVGLKPGVTDLSRVALARALSQEYLRRSRDASRVSDAKAYEERAIDVLSYTMKYATKLGQAVKAFEGFKDIFGATPAVLKATYRRKLDEESADLFAGREEELRRLLKQMNDIKKNGLYSVLVRNEVRDILRRAGKKNKDEIKKIDSFFDKLVIDIKGNKPVMGIPAKAYNKALEKMRLASYGAKSIADIVQVGVDYLRDHGGKGVSDVVLEEFARRMTELLSSSGFDLIDIDKASEDLMKEYVRKLSGMDPKKLKNSIRFSLIDLLHSGALSDEAFRDNIRRAFGYRAVEMDVVAELEGAARMLSDYTKIGDQLDVKAAEYDAAKEKGDAEAMKRLSDELDLLARKYREMGFVRDDAYRKLNNIFAEYPDFISLYNTLVKAGLLTTSSLLVNLVSNATMPLLRAPVRAVATAADVVSSGLGIIGEEIERRIDPVEHPWIYRLLHNAPKSKREYYNGKYMREIVWGGLWGIRAATHDMLKGGSVEDLAGRDIYHGIKPFKAAKALLESLVGARPMKAEEALTRLMEALPTSYLAEFMFRALSAGDRMFKVPYYRARLAEVGAKKGYSGARLRAFIEKPDAASADGAMEYARRMLWQNSSGISKAIAKFVNTKPGDIKGITPIGKVSRNAGRLIVGLVAPFVKTPLGIAAESLGYIIPPIGLIEGIAYTRMGNRQRALEGFAKAMIGSIVGSAAISLVNNGIITPGLSKDKRLRSAQYEEEPPYSVNVDALRRYLGGGDPTPRDGDVYRNIQRFGVISSIFMAYAEAYSNADVDRRRVFDIITTPWYMTVGSMSNNFPALKVALDQTFMVGMNTVLQALLNPAVGGGSNMDRALMSLFRSGSAAFYPNTLAQLSKAFNDDLYIRDTRDLTDPEKAAFRHIKNDFKDRAFSGEDLPYLITPWGEKVRRVDYDQGAAAYLFGVSKKKTIDRKSFRGKIYALYSEHRLTDPDNVTKLLPMPPSRSTEVGWKHFDPKTNTYHGDIMPPDVFEEFQVRVGQLRANYARSYVESPDWVKDPYDVKVEKLDRLYGKARKEVLADMFYWDDFYKDKRAEWERVVSRVGYVPPPRNDKSYKGVDLDAHDVYEINMRAIKEYYDRISKWDDDFVKRHGKDRVRELCNKIWLHAYRHAARVYLDDRL